jgi:hypothetical protein
MQYVHLKCDICLADMIKDEREQNPRNFRKIPTDLTIRHREVFYRDCRL